MDDLTVMALTVWAEARGESPVGQKAVAWVIRNRKENPGWWSRQKGDGIPDDTIAAVCRDPWQFSCWLPTDPNRRRLDDPATQQRPDFLAIKAICKGVLEATSADDDPTSGSDHYCTTAVVRNTAWARNRNPIIVIGVHHFYRLGLNPK